MTAPEEWRPVVGHPGYLVSSHGRVASLRSGSTRLMALTVKAYGYRAVKLPVPGAQRATRSVHSLVAEAFIGLRPDGMEVRHLDGDRLNNHLDNLAYGTQGENREDSVRHGTASWIARSRRSHCKRGHEYTPENTRYSDGDRVCRICKRANDERRRARKRSAATPDAPAAGGCGGSALPAAGLTFDEEMRAHLTAGRPIVDNATDPARVGAYGLEWDGDRCPDCGAPQPQPGVCGDCTLVVTA